MLPHQTKAFRSYLLPTLISTIISVSCSPKAFKVNQFHLRGEKMTDSNAEMVTAEARYRFDQNITSSQRDKKLGCYYVARWNKKILKNDSPVTVRLQYKQASFGETSQIQSVTVDPTRASKAELSVTGDSYLKNGRVLAWKVSLFQNGEILSEETSFLWD